MTVNSVAKKLGIKPGMRALVVAAPPAYLKHIAPLPAGVVVVEAMKGKVPFVQLFVYNAFGLQKSAPLLLKHAGPQSLVWISYPKKSSGIKSDLSRDVVREAMSEMGWRAVSIVAIDEVWSALRFRPVKKDVADG